MLAQVNSWDEIKMSDRESIRQVDESFSSLFKVDGVEMNMTAGSKERLYNFVKSLKDEMVRKSYEKRIFMTLPGRSEDLAKQFDIKELTK